MKWRLTDIGYEVEFKGQTHITQDWTGVFGFVYQCLGVARPKLRKQKY